MPLSPSLEGTYPTSGGGRSGTRIWRRHEKGPGADRLGASVRSEPQREQPQPEPQPPPDGAAEPSVENELPQPQPPVAFGFSTLKPPPSTSST